MKTETLHPFAARALARVRDVTLIDLTGLAGTPWDLDDVGTRWVESIIEDVAETIEYANPKGPEDIDRLADEWATEMADGAVPIYPDDLFRVVLSLQAWHEPIDVFGTPRDLLDAARRAVYMIADRIVRALLDLAKDDRP
jgi:hypothetical protein